MAIDLLFITVSLLSIVVVINRYYLGKAIFYYQKKRRGHKMASIFTDYPKVTITVPCFNEGEGIYHTMKGLVHADYPPEKLKIVVVDDCSTDDSYEWVMKAKAELSEQIMVIRNEKNMGKRKSLNRALHITDSQLILSVDSDVIIDPAAIKILVNSFTDHKIAAIGGKVKVSNTKESWLTKMQTVKYYFGYEFLKGLENGQKQVMCLSGCLTMYRREVLLEIEGIVENRNILGVSIKYGEDRFLTRQIVKAGYQTILNLDACCYTVAPPTLRGYLKQQLRWRRSNFVDFLGGVTHLHRMRPLVALHYVMVAALQFIYPTIVFMNMVYGRFIFMLIVHLCVLLVMCLFYLSDTQYSSYKEKVNPLWFLSMGILMPMTYLFLSPLALFTLDSSSWETRNK